MEINFTNLIQVEKGGNVVLSDITKDTKIKVVSDSNNVKTYKIATDPKNCSGTLGCCNGTGIVDAESKRLMDKNLNNSYNLNYDSNYVLKDGVCYINSTSFFAVDDRSKNDIIEKLHESNNVMKGQQDGRHWEDIFNVLWNFCKNNVVYLDEDEKPLYPQPTIPTRQMILRRHPEQEWMVKITYGESKTHPKYDGNMLIELNENRFWNQFDGKYAILTGFLIKKFEQIFKTRVTVKPYKEEKAWLWDASCCP